MRGEQVAFDAFSDKAQALLVGLLVLATQATGDPGRQLGQFRGNQLEERPGAIQ